MESLVDEVKVKLTQGDGRVLAYCTVVIRGVAIHEIKLIQTEGKRFVSMPSRKLHDRCDRCGGKNHLKARYCNDCGERLRDNRGFPDEAGLVKLYADVCHPIRSDARDAIHKAVLREYDAELRRSQGG